MNWGKNNMKFTEMQLHYLITLVKSDMETLEQLAGDDPKIWKKDLETSQRTMVVLCGGSK